MAAMLFYASPFGPIYNMSEFFFFFNSEHAQKPKVFDKVYILNILLKILIIKKKEVEMLKIYTKYVFLVIFLILLYVCFLIIKPFIPAILTSIVVAYVFYPLYKFLYKKIKSKSLSSLIITLLIILLITVPIAFMLNAIVREAYASSAAIKGLLEKGTELGAECDEGKLCDLLKNINEITTNPKLQFYVQDTIKSITSFISRNVSNFIFSAPRRILDIFIMFFLIFYLFKDGETFVNKIKCLIPLKSTHRRRILDQFNHIIYAVIYGYILMAVIQGSLAMLGFFILKVPNPILWGLATIIAALLPFIGTTLVWLPIGLYFIITGYLQGVGGLILKGILIIAYGILIISSVDNIIRPKFISATGKIHPVIALLGVVGGLFMFGFVGIFVGPLLLALLVTFIDIYIKGNKKKKK